MIEESENSFNQIDFTSTSDKKSENDFQADLRNNEVIESEFKVKIVNYKKVSSFFETFIVYTIETTGDFRPYSTERRYNDFQWLFQRLVERYPMAILPPLPDKHNLTTLERFSGIFIEQRRNALDKFLQRLTDHRILGLDKEYWAFLTLLPTNYNEYKRDRPVHGKVETLFNSIQNISATVTGSTYSKNSIQDSGVKKLLEDSGKCGTIMELLGRVVKRTDEVWDNLSKIYQEEGLQKNHWDISSAVGTQYKQTADNIQLNIEPWVVESSLYWTQVQQVARRRNDAEAKFIASIAKQARIQDHNEDISNQAQQGQVANKLHDIVSKNNADLISELDRWREQRGEETKEWLKVFAELHIDHYRQMSTIWRQVVMSNGCDTTVASSCGVNDFT